MAVRFKFRSSANFDSVDIEGRPSISVRDLKSKIVLNKKLNICQDFDLVFSDALTGQEYGDEDFRIPSGSNVIVKRVPARSMPLDMTHISSFDNSGHKNINVVETSLPVHVDDIDFDDFGVDLCPVPAATCSCSDFDVNDKRYIISKKENIKLDRCSEQLVVGCQKLDRDGLSEGIPKGPSHSGIEENMLPGKSKTKIEQKQEVDRVLNVDVPATRSADFSSEFKCSLCSTLFKDAVMIPCCQHSFCEKCIKAILIDKARCPKCFSTKCRVEDLLPNVSLRQAIDHFLESQILIGCSANALHAYAPDVESGVHAKEVSCAQTVFQREVDLPLSPSATERASNQIGAESVGGTGSHVNRSGSNKCLKMSLQLPKMRHIDERHGAQHTVDLKSGPEDLVDFADFEGESQPVHEEAESRIQKKKALGAYASGAEKNLMESRRHKKGERTCYMCGSPDHFIRDCPAACTPRYMFQTGNVMFPGAIPGYASPYWNGPPLPNVRPFGSMYHGMMPFNQAMVPRMPFATPTRMPSMFGDYPAYGGFMRMGGMAAPVKNGAEDHLWQLDASDLKEFEKRQKYSSNTLRRELSFINGNDDNKTCHDNEVERAHDRKPHINRERSLSCSEDSYTKRLSKKDRFKSNIYDDMADERYGKSSRSSVAGRDRGCYHRSERSGSEVEDKPSRATWDNEERHQQQHRSSKNQMRKHYGSDSSWSHHSTYKEKDAKRKRVKSDAERRNQKDNNKSESGVEASFSSDQDKKQQEKDSNQGARCTRPSSKSTIDKVRHDRWRMVSGMDEDRGEDYHCHKRKRVC